MHSCEGLENLGVDCKPYLYLGTDKQFNVYTAELTAIDLASACNAPQVFTKCRIYTDSQAAIKATVKPDKQSGQTILCNAIKKLEGLTTDKGIFTEIVWAHEHRGQRQSRRRSKKDC